MSDIPQPPDPASRGDDDPPPDSDPAVEVPVRRRRAGDEASEEDEGAARKRLLLLIPLVMAAAAIAALVLVGMQDKGTYSKPVDQLFAERDKFTGRPVRVEGNLVHGSLVKRDSPCEYLFTIEKNGVAMPVRYAGCIVPDTFKDDPGKELDVTVEGRLTPEAHLEATLVLAKCPSKYDMDEMAKRGEKKPHATMGQPR